MATKSQHEDIARTIGGGRGVNRRRGRDQVMNQWEERRRRR